MPIARHPLLCHLFQQDGPVDRTGIRRFSCRICPSRSALALRLAPTRICGLPAHRRCYDAPWIKAVGPFLSVSVSDDQVTPGYACGVRADGTIACWGDDSVGQATPPAGTFTAVSAGSSAACGLKTDGTIACWGDNSYGEASPPAGKFTSLSAGGNYACGIRADGTLACWGGDTPGGATAPAGVFTSISAGAETKCGVRDNGTLTCWGYNGQGQASPRRGASFLSAWATLPPAQ
jgi:hypothetical protein